MQKYTTDIQVYTQNDSVIANCNAITFQNTGTTNVKVLGYTIIPGTSLSISGNAGELDITKYDIIFAANVGDLTVIRKIFV